ncbi:MAG: hypothetical protein ACTH93_09110 [Pseudoclavibacter sp.]
MGKSAILAIKIIGDATGAAKALQEVESKSSRVGSALSAASKVSAVALGAITAGAITAGKAASDLQQATGAVQSVFGDYAGKMEEYGRQAANAVGLSQTQYGNMASVLGAQLKNMGLNAEQAGGKTNDLITVGADLAATYGGTTSDAVEAMSALLRGERDPIEKYGVSIKQADVDAKKAAMGLSGLTGEAGRNADMQATLALLTDQTSSAQGQFARETDSAAGSAQIAQANWENAKAALGEALLPIMSQAAGVLADLAHWFQENATWITPLIGVIAGLAAAIIVINAAYQVFTTVQAAQTVAQWASNAAWLASPITWIIIAIIAAIALVIAIIVLCVRHWDDIKAAGERAWNAILTAMQPVFNWVDRYVVQPIRDVIDWFQRAWQAVRDFGSVTGQVFSDIKQRAVNLLPSWAQNLLGLRSFSLQVDSTMTEQQLGARTLAAPMALMAAPMALMAVPSVRRVSAPSTPAVQSLAAPVAFTSPLDSVAALAALVQASALTSSQRQQPAQYVDNRRYEITLPNYLGEKSEIIDELAEALEDNETYRTGKR